MLQELYNWFDTVREPYFFRLGRNPYRVWISEVVLQQTRIQTALDPLARFFSHFPDIQTLASASEEAVLQAFRGLGYYSRARNLRKAAIYLMQNHQGSLPTSHDLLLTIPTIGPYTAAAISSICFGERKPVVDGNVKRILARLFCWDTPISSNVLSKQCYDVLNPLFETMPYSPGDLNEAIMELGQKICLPKKPNCLNCPIQANCQAYQQKKISQYPVLAIKLEKIPVIWHAYLIANQKQQILLQKWENFYFLKGQIAFPSLLDFPNEARHVASWSLQNVASHFPGTISYHLKSIRHTITNHKIQIEPAVILPESVSEQDVHDPNFIWLPKAAIGSRLVSSALIQIWDLYQTQERLLW